MFLLKTEEDVKKPDRGNGETQSDPEAHVEIEIVGKDRIDRGHALVPTMQNAVFVENRVRDEGEEEADPAADHGPEGEHHADKQQSQIELNAGGNGREEVFGDMGELDPGNGENLDGFRKDHPRSRREQHVERPEDEADHPPDGKDAPLPAGGVPFGGFGQGHIAKGTDGSHREREFLDIGSQPVESVAETEVVNGGNDFKADHQQDRNQPIAVEKGAIDKGIGTEHRGHPGRDVLSQPQHSRRLGLYQILVPEQSRERRSHCRPRHVIEDEDLLLAQSGVGAFGDFGKEDDRDPPGCRSNTRADHQSEVHGTGHHQETDKNCPDDGLPPEPVLEFIGRLEEVTILLEFFIFVHPQPLQSG